MSAIKYEPKAAVQQLEQLFEVADPGRFALFEDIASQFNTPAWSSRWRKEDEDLAPAGEDTEAWINAGIVALIFAVLTEENNYPDANNINNEDDVLKAGFIVTMISVLRAFSWWIYTHKETFYYDREDHLVEFEAVFPVMWERCCLPFALLQTAMPATCHWVGTAPAELVMDLDQWYDSEICDMEMMFKEYGAAADIVLYTFLYPPPSSDVTVASDQDGEDDEHDEHEDIIGSALHQFLKMVSYDTYYYTTRSFRSAPRELVEHLVKLRTWLSVADARRVLYAMEEAEWCDPPAVLAEGILRLYNADPSHLEVICLDNWFFLWVALLERSEGYDPGSNSHVSNARSIYDIVSLITYLITRPVENPLPMSIMNDLYNAALGDNFSVVKLLSQTAMRIIQPIPYQPEVDGQTIHNLPSILSFYSRVVDSCMVHAGRSDRPEIYLVQNDFVVKLKQQVESELVRYRTGTDMLPSVKPDMIKIRRQFGAILENLYQKLSLPLV